jgi:DNA repair ATPase RecN
MVRRQAMAESAAALIDRLKFRIAELRHGTLDRHQWEASANDMRAHLSHTRKLLEAHAAVETELMLELRRHLKGESDRKESK